MGQAFILFFIASFPSSIIHHLHPAIHHLHPVTHHQLPPSCRSSSTAPCFLESIASSAYDPSPPSYHSSCITSILLSSSIVYILLSIIHCLHPIVLHPSCHPFPPSWLSSSIASVFCSINYFLNLPHITHCLHPVVHHPLPPSC